MSSNTIVSRVNSNNSNIKMPGTALIVSGILILIYDGN
ncbi:hypothetical protein HMPREF9955_2482 [Staphylococcus epidermidis FS1]|nr:hypothetical protein HMPREF9955_2482 [Staphylococcus epidermidis FS1]